ncbi:MAG: hypothetical protein ABI886_14460 [Betaproteobacteria bacterium]
MFLAALNRHLLLGGHGNWLEEAGEVELIGGWAEVALADAFVAQVDTTEYQVFLSSYAAALVFVQNRTQRSFEIHTMSAPGRRGHGTVHCAYLVVARAKSA